MSIKTKTYTFTSDTLQALDRLKKEIADAKAIVIGAGAGLSTSAGFTYSGERFHKYFDDFIGKYGFTDMYSAGFFPFETKEEYWAYWSRYVYINRYLDAPKNVYNNLLELVKNKDYFVLTTNVDHCFQKANFDKKRLFYTQGDYGLWQCKKPCHKKTYDNEEGIKAMYFAQKDALVPSELLPKCPVCGGEMSMNLRADHSFIEDEGWYAAAKRYQNFLDVHVEGKVLYLELGVGSNTPAIIKYPFWRKVYQNLESIYVCINLGEVVCPEEIVDKSICIDGDIGEALEYLLD